MTRQDDGTREARAGRDRVWQVVRGACGRWSVRHERHGSVLSLLRSTRDSAVHVAAELARCDAPSLLRVLADDGSVEAEVEYGLTA